jgi:predicted CoA-binding protein/uncharacterized damage-inducible protein DinB
MSRSVEEILRDSSTVAVVGASRDPEKPGGRVPPLLQKRGFRVIPVSPAEGQLFGEAVRESVADIDQTVDIVEVFRPAEEAPGIALAAAAIGARVLWLQEGITSPEAKRIAEEAGMDYVEDLCLDVESQRLGITKTPPGMQVVAELFRHSRWANARAFKVCLAADPALLTSAAGGTVESIDASLRHLTTVEEGFAAAIAGTAGSVPEGSTPLEAWTFLVTPTGLVDGYMKHELGWYAERADHLDSFFVDLVGRIDAERLSGDVKVPWLNFPTTVAEALTQVLVHSGHHRSQVFSALGERGVRVPDLDYVVMLAKERAAAAT